MRILHYIYWLKQVACFIQNHSCINKRFLITPYGILNNRKPNVKFFFHVFGFRCFLYNSKEHRNKFYVKADKRIFFRYSLTQNLTDFSTRNQRKSRKAIMSLLMTNLLNHLNKNLLFNAVKIFHLLVCNMFLS